MSIILIALGGGLGAVVRYLLSAHFSKQSSVKVPVSIILVNIIGTGGLGLFLGHYYKTIAYNFYSCNIYLCIGVGFFGAFTTFSTFSLEAVKLLQKQEVKACLTFIFISIIGSLTAFAVGFFICYKMFIILNDCCR